MHQTKQFKCWQLTQIFRAFCLVMLVTIASEGDALSINANINCSAVFSQERSEWADSPLFQSNNTLKTGFRPIGIYFWCDTGNPVNKVTLCGVDVKPAYFRKKITEQI